MSATKQLTITLPIEMAEAVSARVASGQYANESEVIQDGLSELFADDDTYALFAQDPAFEHWLNVEVVAAYDELQKDPASGIPAEELMKELARRRAGRKVPQAS